MMIGVRKVENCAVQEIYESKRDLRIKAVRRLHEEMLVTTLLHDCETRMWYNSFELELWK